MIPGVDSLNTSAGIVQLANLYNLGVNAGEVAQTTLSAELNPLNLGINKISQVSTPASGSNGTQFTFKNSAGTAIAFPATLLMIIVDVNGILATALTSVAALTNGKCITLVTGQIAVVQTSAAGLLGITFTMTTGSYYCAFINPANGKNLASTVLTIN